MHLSQELASELWPLLKRFAETGSSSFAQPQKPRFVVFAGNRCYTENDSLLFAIAAELPGGSVIGDRATGLILGNEGQWVKNPYPDMP